MLSKFIVKLLKKMLIDDKKLLKNQLQTRSRDKI